MEALAEAGIDFEVIPGVTSAMGAAAAAKIPLTDRRFASKLVFLSNHSAGHTATDWEDVVSKDATHVVYMPGANYAEIAAKLSDCGLAGRTPCLIISHATQAEQQIHRTTLRELALEPRLPAPSLLVIGEVARPLPPLKDDEKTSSRAATNSHEEILDLTDVPVKEEIAG
jgi:siroheme synthase